MNDAPEHEEERASTLPPIRTYKSDVAAALGKQKQTLSGLVASEEKRRREREGRPGPALPEERPWWKTKSVLFVGVGALLLAAAATALGFLFWERVSAPEETIAPLFTDIIPAESERRIPLLRFSRGELETRVAEVLGLLDIPLNSVAVFHFFREEQIPGSLEKRAVPIVAPELVRALESDIPPQLVRTLTDEFFFGAYSFRRTEPFLILRTNFYDGAFLGMLQWETSLARDIAPLLGTVDIPPLERGTFRDAVIENADVRMLLDAAGDAALLYSFADRSTIVIARSAETLREAARRLRAPGAVTR